MVSIVGPRTRGRLAQFAIAWWYGRDAINRYKPILRAEFCEGDSIAEARLLNSAGYHAAAAATARAMLERKIRKAAKLAGVIQSTENKKATSISYRLEQAGLWPYEYNRRYSKLYDKLSGYIHGNSCDQRIVAAVIDSAEILSVKLDDLILTCFDR